jgi:hypothetical protein
VTAKTADRLASVLFVVTCAAGVGAMGYIGATPAQSTQDTVGTEIIGAPVSNPVGVPAVMDSDSSVFLRDTTPMEPHRVCPEGDEGCATALRLEARVDDLRLRLTEIHPEAVNEVQSRPSVPVKPDDLDPVAVVPQDSP